MEQEQSILRTADAGDRFQLKRLLERKSFIHRHLGWLPPASWLGSEPFFLLETRDGELSAALACPPDESGLIWLRLFAAAPGVSPALAWQDLWSQTREWLFDNLPDAQVNSLAVNPEMEELLLRGKFHEINRVVTLIWKVESGSWPAVRQDLMIREIAPQDLNRVVHIDRTSFLPIWRNTLSQLQAAYGVSYYSTVVELDGKPAGYQISTANPQGVHLARLAVDPRFRNQGLGIKLLEDLLDRCLADGIVEVSVNTQIDNLSSLALYSKLGFSRLPESYPVLRWQHSSRST